MKLRALFFLWLCVVLSACSSVNKQKQVSSAAEGIFKRPDRIVIPATINGQPARFVFDTGADAAYLTVEAARRLGLPLTPAPSGRDGWLAGVTSPCTVTIHGVTNRRIFPVVELGGPGAKNFPLDGFLGWTCYQQAIFAIDASNLTLTAYSRVPDEVKTWQKFPLRRDARKFIFEVPLSGGGTGEVFVDTGAPDGVGLYPEKWSQWKATHPNQRLGISHAYMPYLRTGIIFR
ncbi:MAG: retropepsin-like aspartic protease, partial [Chthoniobacterales bacterium]